MESQTWLLTAPLFIFSSCVIQYNLMNVYFKGSFYILAFQVLEVFFDVYSFLCMISLRCYKKKDNFEREESPASQGWAIVPDV